VTNWWIGTGKDVSTAFADVYQRVLPDLPAAQLYRSKISALEGYSPMFENATMGVQAAGGNGEVEQRAVPWERACTRDEWLDEVPTQGLHTRLSPETLRGLVAGVGAAVDALGGGFTMQYTAVAVTAARS